MSRLSRFIALVLLLYWIALDHRDKTAFEGINPSASFKPRFIILYSLTMRAIQDFGF
jgi:hypothetical protein